MRSTLKRRLIAGTGIVVLVVVAIIYLSKLPPRQGPLWDGVGRPPVNVRVISADSMQPVQNATVMWIAPDYKDYEKDPSSRTFEDDQQRARYLDESRSIATTDANGRCSLRVRTWGGGESKRHLFLNKYKQTGEWRVIGAFEVHAEGFMAVSQPLPKSFPDGLKSPWEVELRLARTTSDATSSENKP